MSKLFSLFNKQQAKQLQNLPQNPSGQQILYQVSQRLFFARFPTIQLSEKLNSQFSGKYMIWNISEQSYNTSPFRNQVLDFVYTGYPIPPLDVIFQILTSIKGWLDTDPSNIAVIHCQTSSIRSKIILSTFLAWFSIDGQTPKNMLKIIQEQIGLISGSFLPSQTRYLQYLERIVRGERVINKQPSLKSIQIQRIIINGIPVINPQGPHLIPYIQIFKGPTLIYSSTDQLNQYFQQDLSIVVDINLQVTGDILIRCRHFEPYGKRVTIFKFMFNTSFQTDYCLRFEKSQIDQAQKDPRFPQEFTVDLILQDIQEEGKEENQSFWNSLEKARHDQIRKLLLPDDDQEEVNRELLHKIHSIHQDEDSEEDLDDYFKNLEESVGLN